MSLMRLPRVSVLALILGAGAFLYGAYIPLKAGVAQILLDMAWERRLQGDTDSRPWPWADTAPLARIRQPRLGIDQVVLEGSSGRVLAFGPGHVGVSARPGSAGNVVISGHRDTHFRWLQWLQTGDELVVQTDDGRDRYYRVVQSAIHHESEVGLLEPLLGDQLRLLTCYPFDAVSPGGTQRYVVTAHPAGA